MLRIKLLDFSPGFLLLTFCGLVNPLKNVGFSVKKKDSLCAFAIKWFLIEKVNSKYIFTVKLQGAHLSEHSLFHPRLFDLFRGETSLKLLQSMCEDLALHLLPQLAACTVGVQSKETQSSVTISFPLFTF